MEVDGEGKGGVGKRPSKEGGKEGWKGGWKGGREEGDRNH